MTGAREILYATFTASLPTGAPSIFEKVKTVRFEGRNTVIADVDLFDGGAAIARLTKWAGGWSIGWDVMDGGDCSLDNGRWIRITQTPHASSRERKEG